MTVRSSADVEGYKKIFSGRLCGHTHVICPDSHEMHGLPACDNESWGAYTVAAVYLHAMKRVEDEHEINWQIVNSMAIDADSRVLVSRTDQPDMTSQGVR